MYPGGKGQSFREIINLMPPHQVYIEAFLGGGAVMKHKRPALVNIGLELAPDVLEQTAREIRPDGGYRLVTGGEAPGAAPSVEMARRARAGRVGNGEEASGGDRTAENGEASSSGDRIAGDGEGHVFLFFCLDALAFLRAYPFEGGELVYCDPPYLLETRRDKSPLYQHEYSRQDHLELLSCLLALPCRVAVSGYWSDLYADMLGGWQAHTFTAQTRGGSVAQEWLWMNYRQPESLHDYSYLGSDFRERERIGRKVKRWVKRLQGMDALERGAILAGLQDAGVLPE